MAKLVVTGNVVVRSAFVVEGDLVGERDGEQEGDGVLIDNVPLIETSLSSCVLR